MSRHGWRAFCLTVISLQVWVDANLIELPKCSKVSNSDAITRQVFLVATLVHSSLKLTTVCLKLTFHREEYFAVVYPILVALINWSLPKGDPVDHRSG